MKEEKEGSIIKSKRGKNMDEDKKGKDRHNEWQGTEGNGNERK